jgi:hypothetical protein
MPPAPVDAALVGFALDVPPPLQAAATMTIAAPSVNSRGAMRVLLKCSSTFWRVAWCARPLLDDGRGSSAGA